MKTHTIKTTPTFARIADKAAIHSYEVEVYMGKYVMVDANTRAQAASRATQSGYNVCSVNMVG